jgi:hypothetical protein
MAQSLPMLRVQPSVSRARLRGRVRVNLVQIAGSDDQEAASGHVAAGHLTGFEQLDDGEDPAVPRKADAIADLERRVLLALVEAAQKIDEPPGQTLLDDLVAAGAQAFSETTQGEVDRAVHGRDADHIQGSITH